MYSLYNMYMATNLKLGQGLWRFMDFMESSCKQDLYKINHVQCMFTELIHSEM